MKKYRKCKVMFTDDLKTDISVKPIELIVNQKGQIYNRAKVKQLEQKIKENDIER